MQYEKKRKGMDETEIGSSLPGEAVKPSTSDNALLSANGLLYKLPQSLSTTNYRTVRIQYAERNLYTPGDVVRFVWNTGTSYIDPATAFIRFDVTVKAEGMTAATQFSWGSGSAANLFSEILIQSKNGKELDRITNVDKYAQIRTNWCTSTDAKNALQSSGHNTTFTLADNNAFVLSYSIPMSLVSGFFRPIVKGTKIPANLASGLLIQMTLSPSTNKLFRKLDSDATNLNYINVENPEMYLQSSDLNDPTQSTLLVNSAEVGLDYVYTSTFTDTDVPPGTVVNQVSKKAVSQCLRTWCAVYDTDFNDNINNDGYTTVPYTEIESWQWRLGSSYYPQKTVTKADTAYWLTNQSFDKQRELYTNPASVGYNDFQTTNSIVGVPINSESRLLLSGSPINNSNVLELQMTNSQAGRLHVVWMEYVAVAKCFMNYTDLKI